MTKFLCQTDLKKIITGSTLFSTGGGLTFKQQKKLIQKISQPINLSTNFPANQLAIIPLEIGSVLQPLITNIKLINLLKKAVSNLSIKFILPAEMGQESIAFLTAQQFNLPLIDMDMAGGRAAPRLPINIFSALKLPFSIIKVVSITPQLAVKISSGFNSFTKLESFLRSQIVKNSQPFFLAFITTVDQKIIKTAQKHKTISSALKIGQEFPKLPVLIKQIPTTISQIKSIDTQGFNFQKVILTSSTHPPLILFNQNENLIVKNLNNQIIAKAPTLISLFSPKYKRCLHSIEIKPKQKVILIIKKPLPLWHSSHGKKLWHVNTINSAQRDIVN